MKNHKICYHIFNMNSAVHNCGMKLTAQSISYHMKFIVSISYVIICSHILYHLYISTGRK